ncbi:MAG: VOC family protein [Chloroflexi bacterium]|nr:VOC family protein [Chloroflexota bacterium]
MKAQWMNHTGFVVSDMARSLAFYKEMLGLQEERNLIAEGEWISQVVGYPNARVHIVYLGLGDGRHALELLQYLNPEGKKTKAPAERRDVGATHLGFIVDDLAAFHRELAAKGVKFVTPPLFREVQYPWARAACYLHDPDGNVVEFIERPPAPPGSHLS